MNRRDPRVAALIRQIDSLRFRRKRHEDLSMDALVAAALETYTGMIERGDSLTEEQRFYFDFAKVWVNRMDGTRMAAAQRRAPAALTEEWEMVYERHDRRGYRAN